MASTGVASTITMLTTYIDQTNSGSRNQVMPGRTQHVDGGDEIDAGGDRGKADDEDAGRGGDHVGVGISRRERRIEGPAGVDAAGQAARRR